MLTKGHITMFVAEYIVCVFLFKLMGRVMVLSNN